MSGKSSSNSKTSKYLKIFTWRGSYIVNMQFAFQDRENLYLVMDLLTGGDLRYHIARHRRFSEEQTKFFIACIVVALEYIHSKSILHRDIKPENLVFDDQGYLRVTDFGIARIWNPDNSKETSGTPGYMAPEVMCRQNHGVAVDYFALGVIAYECMMGRVTHLYIFNCSGHTWVRRGRRSGTTYWLSRFKSRDTRYHRGGLWKARISLTD